MMYDYLIVGAGFAGSVMAERLASQGNKKILLVEKRDHIGGNAYDEYGILIHRYGPHIFHTNSKEVFNYLSQFTEWIPYEHKVLAKLNNVLYPIPINRSTLNRLYNLNLQTEKDTEKFYESVREKRNPIRNSEDIIVNKVGFDLFEKFFKSFTKKQWNMEPKELSPAVCGRIPVRTNDDNRYFMDKYQFMPKHGYTKMFEKMLLSKNIEIVLNMDYKTIVNDVKFNKLIYTGPIDYFFDYKLGKLPYRSIRFKIENYKREWFQENSVINYVGSELYTRVSEYKYLTGQKANSTTVSFEFAEKDGEPYYPTLTPNSKNVFNKYKKYAQEINSVYFVGRLANFQYFNMDQVVANCLNQIDKKIL